MALTPRQQRFVSEYLVDLNATQAAIRAGYSAKTAKAQGSRLLTNVDVQASIAERQQARSRRTEISADRVIAEYARIAFADPRRIMSWGPDGVTLLPSASLTADDAAVVAEASQTTSEGGGSIRVKLVDKLGALNALARHLGLLTDKVKIEASVTQGPAGLPDLSKLNDDQLREFRSLLAVAAGPRPVGIAEGD